MDKILKLIEVEGVKRDEDSIHAIRSRQQLIIRAISIYLKRYVQIMEYDPLMQPESELLIPGHVLRMGSKIGKAEIKKN